MSVIYFNPELDTENRGCVCLSLDCTKDPFDTDL